MSRISLLVSAYPPPHRAEALFKLPRKDGDAERVSAVIDTAAQTSFLPFSMLDDLVFRITEREKVVIEQAGMSKQTFEAVEAILLCSLEDQFGGKTAEFEAPFWFADTDQYLLGMTQMRDRAILHLDMPALTGYLEFPD